MACYSPLKGYKDNRTNGLIFKNNGHVTQTMEVACGQCLGCRLDRTLMWAMRIVHESALYESSNGNCFVTLTYRDLSDTTDKQFKRGHHIPADLSLNYHHFKDFIKRLRRHYGCDSSNPIRYFHCGEYGDETLRPHYHACLFNCSFEDQQIYQSTEGITTYSSPTLEKLWPFGFSTIGELNFDTASYTAGYILKKITGVKADDFYLRSTPDGEAVWVKPPYITMSLKPGIGADFYDQYKGDFFPSDESPVPGLGIIKKVPRYYQNLLEKSQPELLDEVKKMRQIFINAHRDDFTPERLYQKYHCAKARQQTKKRTL